MRPNKIQIRNFKGRIGTYLLEPVNIIVGENAAGKSAIVEAVKLAMLGYDLRLGKRNQDTAKLMSGSTASVYLNFDNNKINMIDLIESRGKITNSQTLEVKFPSIALDASEYFTLTGPQRVKFLFDRLGMVAFDVANLTAQVRQIQGDPHTAACEKIIGELCDDLEQLDRDRAEMNEPLNTWFDKVIQRWTERGTQADYQAKLMKGSVGATTVLQAAENARPPRQGLDAEIAKLRKEDQALVEQAAKLRADLDRQAQDADRTAKALESRQKAEQAKELSIASLWGRKDPSPELELMKTSLARLRERKPTGQPEPGPTEETAHARADALKQQIEDKSRLFHVEQSEFKAASENSVCPTCGGKTKGWLAKLTTKHEEKLAEIKGTIASLETHLQTATVAEKEAKARDECNAKVQQALQEWNTRFIEAQNIVQGLTERKATWDQHQAVIQAPLQDVPVPFQADPEAQNNLNLIAIDRQAFATKIRELEAEQKQAVAAQADARRRQEAQERLDSSEAEAKLCKTAVKLVRDTQETIIGHNIQAVMGRASLFIEPVMGWKVEFRDGEIGYVRKAGGWVTHETLSGTEQLLVYAGLCSAFSAGAPSRIVIMDELGRLSTKNKVALLSQIDKAVGAGLLDCFIGIDTDAGAYASLPVNIITV